MMSPGCLHIEVVKFHLPAYPRSLAISLTAYPRLLAPRQVPLVAMFVLAD